MSVSVLLGLRAVSTCPSPHLTRPSLSLGGENLAVAQNNYAVLWFKGKELNMVFGLLLSVSRIVSRTYGGS